MNITNDFDAHSIFEPHGARLTQVASSYVHTPTQIPTLDRVTTVPEETNFRYVNPTPKSGILVEFVRTHPDAILPFKNHPDPKTGDAGYDLFAVETTTIPARGSAIVPVGLTLGFITPGYWFRIESRSGNAFKKELVAYGGIIDNPYRGDLGVKLFNFSDQDQVIEKGKGAAQFVVYEMLDVEIAWREEVQETERGEKGFGSSDEVPKN